MRSAFPSTLMLLALLPQLSWAALPRDPREFPRFTDSFTQVDQQIGARELTRLRGKTSFAMSIESALRDHAGLQMPSLGGNDRLFSVLRAPGKVSLLSHPQCSVSQASLRESIGSAPGQRTVDLANEFSRQMNQARDMALFSTSGSVRLEGWDRAMHLYSKLMGCLAYAESLTTADASSSDAVARSVGPKGYSRPGGVLFYRDPLQTNSESQLNIGLYQFSPDPRGNVLSCVESWNARHPGLKFASPISKSTMIRALGNESQRFNAYCGVNKLLQSYFIQANTTSRARTHAWNLVRDAGGKVAGAKLPSERCVSPYFNSKAYNHFGPLQNTTGSNLHRVLSCTLL
jgi:hypothetical protein